MSNTDRHPKCHMRTALGNCDPIGGFCTSVNESICEALHKVSSPQGEWITIDTEVISVPVYWNEEQRQSDERGAGILEKCKCSVCGWRKSFMGYKKLGVNKSYNYCPNCGAKMDEERKGKCKECWYWSEVYKRCENKCGCQFKPYEERKESE